MPTTESFTPSVIPYGAMRGKVTEHILTNGETFRCADCDFTAGTYGVVRSHRAIHSGRQVGRPKGSRNRSDGEHLGHLIAEAAALVESLLDEARKANERADRAEAALRKVRAAAS